MRAKSRKAPGATQATPSNIGIDRSLRQVLQGNAPGGSHTATQQPAVVGDGGVGCPKGEGVADGGGE